MYSSSAGLARSSASAMRAKAKETGVVVERAQAAKTLAADDLLGHAQSLHGRALALLDRAETQGKTRDALLGIRESASTLRSLGEVLGRLQSAAQVHLTLIESPEWLSLQAKILAVLDRHPAARADVLAALLGDVQTIPTLPAHTAGFPGSFWDDRRTEPGGEERLADCQGGAP